MIFSWKGTSAPLPPLWRAGGKYPRHAPAHRRPWTWQLCRHLRGAFCSVGLILTK